MPFIQKPLPTRDCVILPLAKEYSKIRISVVSHTSFRPKRCPKSRDSNATFRSPLEVARAQLIPILPSLNLHEQDGHHFVDPILWIHFNFYHTTYRINGPELHYLLYFQSQSLNYKSFGLPSNDSQVL